MMAVRVRTHPDFNAESPRLLFANPAFHRNMGTGEFNYDVAPDGRFIMIRREGGVPELHINIVLNWVEELKQLVPTTN